MRIDKITLNNFRQYQSSNTIDLKTSGDKNIILIGGKNGYGKTNFLISLVWCLYGEDISKIDDNFKKEITKEHGYSKFLKGALNWDAEKKGEDKFSVEIELSEKIVFKELTEEAHHASVAELAKLVYDEYELG